MTIGRSSLKMAAPLLSSSDARRSRAVEACSAQVKEDDGPMAATLTAPVEALLREQVANGHFPSLDRALEAAVKKKQNEPCCNQG